MTFTRSAFRLSLAALLLILCWFTMAKAQDNQQEPPKIIRKSGGLLQTSAIKRAEPVYPPLARAARISGSVVVEVTLDEDGKVISARAVSGHPLLKDAAVAAAREWTFEQTKLSGTPVKVIGTITFHFAADEKAPLDDESLIEKLKNVIAINPSSHQPHQMLGLVYAENNRFKNAVEEFHEAVRLLEAAQETDRTDQKIKALYLDSLGWAYFKLGELEEAERYLSEADRIQPSSAAVQEHLGDLYQRKGKIEEALAAWQKALSLLSDQPDQAARIKAKLDAVVKK